jgi:crossover junction endodeoxyribonuclease RuvC
MPVILGIDPGLNTTGYGVIVCNGSAMRLIEAGVVRTRAKGAMESRLAELHEGIAEIIAAHHPDRMAIEQLFSHYERVRTAILMGHARGVICLAAGQAKIPVTSYEPTRIKKTLTGSGRAAKAQMQMAVKLQLRLTSLPEPHDVADALAVAICSHHLERFGPVEDRKIG